MRLGKVTGLDKVEIGSPLIQSRLLIHPKRLPSDEGVKSIEEELKNAGGEVIMKNLIEVEAVRIEESKVAEADSEGSSAEMEKMVKVYDEIIVTILDILNYLYVISSKEMIAKFIQDRELSMALAKYFFLTTNEGVRLQILEFYR